MQPVPSNCNNIKVESLAGTDPNILLISTQMWFQWVSVTVVWYIEWALQVTATHILQENHKTVDSCLGILGSFEDTLATHVQHSLCQMDTHFYINRHLHKISKQ